MFEIRDYTSEILKESDIIKTKQMIDDIFIISQGVYKCYKDYVNIKQQMIEAAREANNNNVAVGSNKLSFTYYVEPIILNERIFNYIVDKYYRGGF